MKHRKARRGWDSLTPTEVKITEMVAQGLSNPQIAAKLFLSRRTVGTHVSHILSKLDVHSRIDIAREGPAAIWPSAELAGANGGNTSGSPRAWG